MNEWTRSTWKCWAHSPREPPHAHSAGVATGTVARRLRIDVHDDNNDDDDNDNAWQRGPLYGPMKWAQWMKLTVAVKIRISIDNVYQSVPHENYSPIAGNCHMVGWTTLLTLNDWITLVMGPPVVALSRQVNDQFLRRRLAHMSTTYQTSYRL